MLLRIKKIIKKNVLVIKQFTLLLDFLLFQQNKIKKADVVFFFPFYHTGGAELVHLNIVKALNNKNNCVLFLGKSASNNFLSEFEKNSTVLELYDYLNSNFAVNFIKKRIIKQLNNNSIMSVFGCNCTFFYDILPYLKKSIKKIDLIHAFSTPEYGIEKFSANRISYLDNRVVINEKTKLDLINQYKTLGIESFFLKRIIKIENGIYLDNSKNQSKEERTKIGFVGRWSNEKRPELFLKIAEKIHSINEKVEFVMAGSQMEQHKAFIEYFGVTYLGEIKEKEKLEDMYSTMTILLITSYREGFPIVIMEAMANGVVPVSTNVGGIGEHINNYQNGVLIEDSENEDIIVDDFCEEIIKLLKDKKQLQTISENAHSYALSHFRIEKFNQSYINLLVYES